MRNTGWKALQIIQLIVFTCFSVFLFTRAVDEHGAVRGTGDTKRRPLLPLRTRRAAQGKPAGTAF